MYPPDAVTAATEAFFEDFTLEPSEPDTSLNGAVALHTNDLHNNSPPQAYQSQLSGIGSYFAAQPMPAASSPSRSDMDLLDEGLRRVNASTRPVDSFESASSSEKASLTPQMYSVPYQTPAVLSASYGNHLSGFSQGASFDPMQQRVSTSVFRPESPSLAGNAAVTPFGSPQNSFASPSQPIMVPGRHSTQTAPYPTVAASPTQPFIHSPTVMSPLAQSVYSTSPLPGGALAHSLPVSQQMMLFYSQQSLANARASFRNLSLLSQSPTLTNFSSPSMTDINSLNPYGSTDNKAVDSKDALLSPLDKKERNRLAAERCRKKKAELIQQLTAENQFLRQENSELIKINLVLEQKLDYLISVLASYGISIPK